MKRTGCYFDGRRFYNQQPKVQSFAMLLRWILFGEKRPKWPIWVSFNNKPNIVAKVNSGFKITYINHTTFLIQIAGINILTDPIWSDRASPFKWMGPKRVHAPGLAFADLPAIDLVLISHSHYDHLDLTTLQQLQQKFAPTFVCGLKIGQYLTKLDRNFDKIKIQELDWWQEFNFGDLEIIFTPAQHWSARSLFVKDTTLWGGFIIKDAAANTPNHTLYFAGDTGFGPHFQEIAAAFAPITVAMLPIGSYLPRWFMQYSHMDPKEALQAHKILQSKLSLGMHFNCFKNLADEAFNAAPQLLAATIAADPGLIAEGDFIAPLPGEQVELAVPKTVICAKSIPA